MLALLRPKPFRGDQVAAGTVVLSVLVLLLTVRFAGDWSAAAHLAYTAAAAGLVLGMAVAAPAEPAGPPAWHSTLYVAGFVLAGAALVALADVLGSTGGAGTVAWIGALLTVLAGWMSRARSSAAGTLLCALAAVVTTLAVLGWAADPDGAAAYRRLLLADVIVLVLVALWERVRRPAHGVQLLNAVGATLLAIASTLVVPVLFGAVFAFGGPDGTGAPVLQVAWGWELLMLAGGIGILSAGAADRERGNVAVGIVLLAAFVGLATRGDLVGWPVLLAGAAGALLVIGLRPSTPLPEAPPDAAGDEPGVHRIPLPPVRPVD